MNMIERVARAMFQVELDASLICDDCIWEELPPRLQRLYRSQARAVIEAMREPDERMLLAARDWEGACTGNAEQDCEPILEMWQEMIDAALEDRK